MTRYTATALPSLSLNGYWVQTGEAEPADVLADRIERHIWRAVRRPGWRVTQIRRRTA